MPEKLLYEYAIIRIVPRVERGEFINAGVILYCRDAGYLEMKYEINKEKIIAIYKDADLGEIKSTLKAFEKVSCGHEGSGTIGALTPAERFRWLTAKRSTILQLSAVHPGMCDDPALELDKLFRTFVKN